MTAQEAIELARILRPDSALAEDVLLRFLSGLDTLLAVGVRKEDPTPACPKTAVTHSCLTVPSPFDNVYWTYLVAMMDLAEGSMNAYRTSYALYQEARDAYAKWYQRTGGVFA